MLEQVLHYNVRLKSVVGFSLSSQHTSQSPQHLLYYLNVPQAQNPVATMGSTNQFEGSVYAQNSDDISGRNVAQLFEIFQ